MIALVTGANRGLGFGVCEYLGSKGHTVIMTARNKESLILHEQQLKEKKYDVHAFALDVSKPKSIESAASEILNQFKQVDILINNAGIFADGLDKDFAGLSNDMLTSFQTNTVGPALMIQAFLPTMKKNNFGRIVNVSTGMAGLREMNGGYLAYRASKTALNAVTRVFANECQGTNILVNSVCPGWVKTDMGGAGATRSIPEGVASIVWAAEIPNDGPTGGFFRDGKALDW